MSRIPYNGSYLWGLRQIVGQQLLLVPGAQAVVMAQDGKILLQQASDTGHWGLPAGACEENSTFAQTAIAELREETGLIAEENDLVPLLASQIPECMFLDIRMVI